MSRLNTMFPNDDFLKGISNVMGKIDSKNEIQLKQENQQLQNNWNELKEWLEEEKTRLARECSNHYTDSLDRYRAVNKDIYDELVNVLNKIQEIESRK